MQQQVDVIIKMTYSADAKLSRKKLIEQITDDIHRLGDPDSESKVEMQSFEMLGVKEEAEIYGNV